MMNLELTIGEYCTWEAMRQIIDMNCAGTEILRRTYLILMPKLRRILANGPIKSESDPEALWLYFGCIELLTGFGTVGPSRFGSGDKKARSHSG